MAIASARGLVVIEDAAHAHGASYQGRPAGSIGHMASFSFQSSKNLTAGEGGIITTNDEALAEACRSIQNCGRVPGGVWYEHHVVSGNYRLGEFQGAVLNGAARSSRGAGPDARGERTVPGVPTCGPCPASHPQARPADCTRHSYHLFMLRLDAAAFGAPRARRARGARGRRHSVLERLRILAASPAAFPQQGVRSVPRRRRPPGWITSRCAARRATCICREQSIWLEHAMLLGSRADIEDIARAFEKVYEHRAAADDRLR